MTGADSFPGEYDSPAALVAAHSLLLDRYCGGVPAVRGGWLAGG
jgi:hypothetical protein